MSRSSSSGEMSPMDVPHLKSEYRGSASSTAFHRRANSSKLEARSGSSSCSNSSARTLYVSFK